LRFVDRRRRDGNGRLGSVGVSAQHQRAAGQNETDGQKRTGAQQRRGASWEDVRHGGFSPAVDERTPFNTIRSPGSVTPGAPVACGTGSEFTKN
jgi:hypothetical protein